MTQHDPDPGEEIMTDPNNKELLNAQPEPDDDYFPPADPEDPDPIKLLKESSISFQREAIAQKFASLEGEDPAEVYVKSENVIFAKQGMRGLFYANIFNNVFTGVLQSCSCRMVGNRFGT